MEIQLAEEKLCCRENSLEEIGLAHGFPMTDSSQHKQNMANYTALPDAKAFERITFIFESIHLHNAAVTPTR